MLTLGTKYQSPIVKSVLDIEKVCSRPGSDGDAIRCCRCSLAGWRPGRNLGPKPKLVGDPAIQSAAPWGQVP